MYLTVNDTLRLITTVHAGQEGTPMPPVSFTPSGKHVLANQEPTFFAFLGRELDVGVIGE